MSLDWKTVKAEHVRKVCEGMLASGRARDKRQRGLFVTYRGVELPAKEILAMAYRLANTLPADAKLRFSSGEATISRLRSLGFDAMRRGAVSQTPTSDEETA